eukprot:CAMPEP_0113870826 /NCGR_PEP_ID=MMETSP0780_2-20120614/2299_1 /TAXON_ID=652834 /ORGANISM="Palpitomonas bilix" /LENGTH=389 /DNA_ID=CAMNT_0000856141 /DNA_START=145 /DNA_END=1314 /DNA_ORIENTATION=+ /assembly_acc=CAM_ASM_000599
MVSAGAFYQAPLTKFLMMLGGGATLMVGASKVVDKFALSLSALTGQRQLWRIIPSQFLFGDRGDLLVSLLLLYRMRMHEKLLGSSKYAGFLSSSFIFSVLAQLGFLVLVRGTPFIAPGMHWLVYAQLVQYYFDIPALERMKFAGLPLSEKSFNYMLGVFLLFSQRMPSVLAGASGILAGVMYRMEFLGLQKWRAPAWLRSMCRSYLLPLLFIYDPVEADERRRNMLERRRQMLENAGFIPRGRQRSDGDGVSQGYVETLVPDERHMSEEAMQAFLFSQLQQQRQGQRRGGVENGGIDHTMSGASAFGPPHHGGEFGRGGGEGSERMMAGSMGMGESAVRERPGAPAPVIVNEDAVHQLLQLGFEEERVRQALQQTRNNPDAAAELLFSA